MYYCYYDSPVGRLMLTGDQRLESISFPLSKTRPDPGGDWKETSLHFSRAITQLDAYFKGGLKKFDLDIAPRGTPFQEQVWQELMKIPHGTTITYGELAERIGNPKACRAVGLANGKNPLPIVIPCHRVVGKNGKLTGFGGGVSVKKQLLELEQQNE